MAFEADRVVVELIAKTDGFDAKIQQTSGAFDASMNKISASATKAETAFTKSSGARIAAIQKESAQISRFSGIIGTQLNDVGALLTSPKSPFVAPVKQAPQVASAMRLVSVAGGAMGAILGGVVVTGALAAGAALLSLILKTDDTTAAVNDLVEKLKENAEKTQQAERANAIFASTIEGVTAALDANEKILDKLNDSTRTAARVALENAIVQSEYAKRIRETNVALLEQAEAQLLVLQAQSSGGRGNLRDTGAAASARDVEARIAAIRGRITEATTQLNRAAQQVDEALSRRVVERTQEMADPVKRINALYDRQIESVRKLAVTNKTVTSEINKQVAAIEAQRRAALKAEQDRKRVDNSNRQSGRQINEADARRIVAGIGGTVTSGGRSAQHNKDVGGVAGSFHVKGQALDIAKTAGLTLGKIVKAFEKEGVRLIEKLDEGDHFHIAWAKRGGRGRQGPSAETLAARALAAADAAERREQAFQNEKASLQADEIDARQALITAAEEIAKLEIESIEISRQKYADNVASLVTQRKLTAAEAAELLKINDERAKLRTELVLRREAERQFRMREAAIERQNAVQAGGLQAQQELLQAQQGLARSQRERLEIGRRLVDLQFQEERLALEAAVARAARLKAEYARTKSQETLALLEQAEVDAAIARQRLGTIDQRQAGAQTGNAEANASPLQSYFGDIQAQADDLNTAFEQIAAGGLATFTDALTNAIVNFTSLGDVGRAVLQALAADLVKMAIQQVLLKTVGAALGAAATATTVAQAAAAGAAWAPAAAAASLATLGANAGPAAAALASTHALSAALAIPKREGGAISGPGGPTDDRVLIAASNGEFMIRASTARRIGYSALDHLNRTGQMPGYANGGRIRSVSPVNMPASSPRGGGFSSGDINALRGIIGEAVNAGVSAMPDVSLYAGLDPAELLQRALASPAGEKAVFAMLGRNSGRVNSTLANR